MRPLETILGVVCVLAGVRSAVHWLRRPIDSTRAPDHLLLALFVLTRVGAWMLLAAWLLVGASLRNPDTGDLLQGRAVLDTLQDRYLWIPTLFVVSLATNVVAGWFLGRRGSLAEEEPAEV
jgi:hypothetical protein